MQEELDIQGRQGEVDFPGMFEMRANPVPYNGTFPANRRLFCTRYDSCLDLAVKRQWKGFSCEQCMGFMPTEWDSEDQKEDEFHCMALLLVVFCERRHIHLNPGSLVESLERATRSQQWLGGMFLS